jgi:hypothetical protein
VLHCLNESSDWFAVQSGDSLERRVSILSLMVTDPPVARSEDPLAYWRNHQNVYPHLFNLAKKNLCSPASSVPCERVFSKSGEVVSKKRNRLSPKTVEKIMYLNKNL